MLNQKRKKLPSVSYVCKLRDRIFESLVLRYIGVAPEGSSFGGFVGDVRDLLPKGISEEVVLESCRYLLGKVLDKKALYEFAWRLAGNISTMKENKPVYPWTEQYEEEFVPMQIIEGTSYINKREEKGFLFKFRIQAGSPCPLVISKFWTNKFCRFMAQELGFTYPDQDFPFVNGQELVSLRLIGLIDPQRCREQPAFDKGEITSACLTWNKQILKARNRIGVPCPGGYDWKCFKCPIGYDKCFAGTHPRTYTLKYCYECDKESYFDTNKNYCVNCLLKF